MLDYILVGGGIAGLSFARKLEEKGHSFVMFDDNSRCATNVAGGLYNPVFIKYLKKVWLVDEALPLMLDFVKDLESLLSAKFLHEVETYKLLRTEENKRQWESSADLLTPYASSKISENRNSKIDSPHGIGIIEQSGRVEMSLLKERYLSWLLAKGAYFNEKFECEELQIRPNFFVYKELEASKILFCEGVKIEENPFFSSLPIYGNKGEWLEINAPEMDSSKILQSTLFVIPMGGDTYKIGATYQRIFENDLPSEEARKDLEQNLHKFFKGAYSIIKQGAGVRPTTASRRPIMGCHPKYKNMFVLNGLGSRGMLHAPYLAAQMYDFIQNNKPILDEVKIRNKWFL